MQNGDLYKAPLEGIIHADQVELKSEMQVSGNVIPWTFKGSVQGNNMQGSVSMGEYGNATWTAIRA